jgi:PAS domain S-box-containing protein
MMPGELLQDLPDGVVLVDAVTGKVLEANAEFSRQSGREADALRRLALWQLCPPFAIEAQRARFLALPEGTTAWVLDLLRPDGIEVPVELRARRVVVRGRRCVLLASRDVTEARTAERLGWGELDELRRLRREASESA